VNSDQPLSETFAAAPARGHFALSVVIALIVHVAVLWALASSMLFQLPVERPPPEPKIVALAPQLLPPPPDVEKFGPVDIITSQPRFRPREAAVVPERQKREGDPALAVWKHLCNDDISLSVATRRECPPNFGNVDMSALDPLNRTGDVGALFGPDTTTMSLDEVAKKKGWLKPKAPLEGAGARARDSGVGPGHDPFAILPGHRPIR